MGYSVPVYSMYNQAPEFIKQNLEREKLSAHSTDHHWCAPNERSLPTPAVSYFLSGWVSYFLFPTPAVSYLGFLCALSGTLDSCTIR